MEHRTAIHDREYVARERICSDGTTGRYRVHCQTKQKEIEINLRLGECEEIEQVDFT